jgi:hypothetical protein
VAPVSFEVRKEAREPTADPRSVEHPEHWVASRLPDKVFAQCRQRELLVGKVRSEEEFAVRAMRVREVGDALDLQRQSKGRGVAAVPIPETKC